MPSSPRSRQAAHMHSIAAAPPAARGGRDRGWRARRVGWVVEHRARILAAFAAISIVVGGLLHLVGLATAGNEVWRAAVVLLSAELAFEVARTVIVDHHMGVDTIALVAMVGSLALGEELAGVIVGLMFSGGAALEDVASTRARRELTALVQRAPKVAQLRRRRAAGAGARRARAGRRRRARPYRRGRAGRRTVVGGEAVVDTSTLSGEPLPVTIGAGMPVLSGSANAGAPFEVRADRPAAESAYAALVRLVEQAQSAPGAVRADGRPLRRVLPAGDAARRRRGLGG